MIILFKILIVIIILMTLIGIYYARATKNIMLRYHKSVAAPAPIPNSLLQLGRFYRHHKQRLTTKETRIFKRYFIIRVFVILAIMIMAIMSIRNIMN